MNKTINPVTDEEQAIIKDMIVACGYARECHYNGRYVEADDGPTGVARLMANVEGKFELLYPLQDTRRSHLQADALETWLGNKEPALWHESETKAEILAELQYPMHQWRIDRIHWVIQQLYLEAINTKDE